MSSSFNSSLESWKKNHVVSIQQFNRPSLTLLCSIGDSAKVIVDRQGGCEVLKHKVLANIFMEPSSRTSSSFAAAMQRLGGTVIQLNESTSSAVKGESLADTIRTMNCYTDALVLRHPQQGSALIASKNSIGRPFLNAGDGVGEHPTQALLDLYTIVCEQRRSKATTNGIDGVDGLTIVLIGDLKHGRTVHSLAKLLAMFSVTLVYVNPPELGMPQEVQEAVKETSGGRVMQEVYTALDAALLARADVLYVTRVQKERFASPEEYERLKLAFIITPEIMKHSKSSAILMHPLPRVGEIDDSVDSDPRAAYFRQMECGLYIRMALLTLLFGCSENLQVVAATPCR
jgi:aspartate carbamoyltransferase